MVNKNEGTEIYNCAKCGTEVDNNAEKCPKCGVRLMDQDNLKSVDDKTIENRGSKIIGIVITFIAITVASSISPIIKYFSNQDSIEYSDYNDWEKISLYDIGITLKSPSKLNQEVSSLNSNVMNSIIYSGGIQGFEFIILGSKIEDEYYYDLERGAIGSINRLESDGTLNNLKYEISEWNRAKFENKFIRGSFMVNGNKGELLSLFGKKNDKMFSVLILISPVEQRVLDLGYLLLGSIEFLL